MIRMKGFEFPELKDNSSNTDEKIAEEVVTSNEEVEATDELMDQVVGPTEEEVVPEVEEVIEEKDINPYGSINDEEQEVEEDIEEEQVDDSNNEEFSSAQDYEDDEEYAPYEDETTYEEEYPEEDYEEEYDDEVEDYTESEDIPIEEVDDSLKTLIKEVKEENAVEKKLKQENLKKFRIAFIVVMVIICIMLIVINNQVSKTADPVVIGDPKIENPAEEKPPKENPPVEEPPKETPKDDFNALLEELFNDGDNSKVLEMFKNDYQNLEVIDNYRETLNTFIDNKISAVSDNDSANYDELVAKLEKINGFIDKVKEVSYEEQSLISNEGIEQYKNKVQVLKDDSFNYYDGLSYYNNKDYNNAYISFAKIDNSSSYYEKAISRIAMIHNSILELIENDINTISTNLDLLDEEGKKEKYTQIKNMIEKYAKAYQYTVINGNSKYNELLEKYTNLAEID